MNKSETSELNFRFPRNREMEWYRDNPNGQKLIDEMLVYISCGASPITAASSIGIYPRKHHDWIQKGEVEGIEEYFWYCDGIRVAGANATLDRDWETHEI